MWENLKVYKQLDKKDINSTFKKFGKAITANLDNLYKIEQTTSLVKLSRQVNQLEQSIFIEKRTGGYDLKIQTCIKPIDFYKKHKFTMVNIVPLGDIMNNYRRTFYPLTQEWDQLAIYLSERIKNEIELYFQKYSTYEKIIDKKNEIEPKDFGLSNKFELLIYAAIRTKNKSLLLHYLDMKMSQPSMEVSYSEYLKPDSSEINEADFLQRLKTYVLTGDFVNIENEIAAVSKIN